MFIITRNHIIDFLRKNFREKKYQQQLVRHIKEVSFTPEQQLIFNTHAYGIHPAEKGKHNHPIVIGGGRKDGKRTIIRVAADREALQLEMLDDGGKVVGNLKIPC